MSNSFGEAVTVTLFGESHGTAIGAVLDGIRPGVKIDDEYIKERLTLRRPYGKISTSRVEEDAYEFVSGVYNGYTTGAPLTVIIKNENTKSSDYEQLKDTPRPSHADYTALLRYGEYRDHRGGGHFSGRLTAALVAVGAVAALALKEEGVEIGTHILSLGGIKDREFDNINDDIAQLNQSRFPVLDSESATLMQKRIDEVASEGDSIGGILETCAVGMPAGIGDPWFDTVEGELAKAMLSIPGVKGVEFGLGFGFGDGVGSECNDPFVFEDGKIRTSTNNNGGVNGGITNGMPLILRLAVKPTPSIFKEQATVSLKDRANTTLTLTGRHDPAIVHRVRAVADAMCAITLLDFKTRAEGYARRK